MSSLVACQIRLTDHLTEIVDVVGYVVRSSSQVAEVGWYAVLPEQSVSRREVEAPDEIERGAAS